MSVLKSIYKFFSSYALASIVLISLTVLTLFGTLAQKDMGLYQAKKEYFHSMTYSIYEDAVPIYKPSLWKKTEAEQRKLIQEEPGKHVWYFPIWIPLPGGMLLMSVLFINMVLGAMVHLRKRWRGVPMLVAHSGILFLLVSGFVTWRATMKRDGYVALFPGETTNRAQSYREWQVEIVEFNDDETPKQAVVIPWNELKAVGVKGAREFTSAQLPFTVKVENFYRNARPIPIAAPISAEAKGAEVDGFKLLQRNRMPTEEANFPGCFVSILPSGATESVEQFIVSGTSDRITPSDQSMAAGFKFGEKQWGVQLVKKSWEIGFYINLKKFIFEKHPGTEKAKNYESRIEVRSTLDGEGKAVAVRMNEPMRDSGFVVFQESYGAVDQGPEKVYYSQFAISENPADQWPLYALIVVGIGMMFHFLWTLAEYISKTLKRRAKANCG